MTGYTVHTGASKKFVAGWDNIFSGGKNDSASTDAKDGKKKKTTKAAKKSKGKKK